MIVFLPQFLYWHYLSGSLFNYSYGNEGFNWLNPKFISVWISPNNGLFLYTPFYLLIMASLILMIKNKKLNGIYILILFFVISYIFASWWSWSFGCAFGSRSYIEYLSLFSIPLAYGFQEISKMIFIKKAFAGVLILILIVFNLKMTYSYDGCFYGVNNWDWNSYLNLILSATK